MRNTGSQRFLGCAPIVWILLASLAWRLPFAALVPLGVDEAYALAVGRYFPLSFFDHPPIGFWAPAVSEYLLGVGNELLMRLPNLVFGCLSIIGMYLTGTALGGRQAGTQTALLAALAPPVTYSGILIVPDSPLLACLAFAAYALVRLAQGEVEKTSLWLLAGASMGLALASKYQAGLVGLGILIFVAATPQARRWLALPGFWLASALTIAGAIPVVLWNMLNGWPSFTFHTGRVVGDLNLLNFGRMLLAQAIYLTPVLLVLCLRRFFARASWRDSGTRVLMFTASGTVLLFNAIYLLTDSSLPHWSMPGFFLVLPVVALWMLSNATKALRMWLWLSMGLIHLLVTIAALYVGGLLSLPLGNQADHGDLKTLIPLSATRTALSDSGILDQVELVNTNSWSQGGHLSAALGPDIPVRVIGHDKRHFSTLPPIDDAQTVLLMEISHPRKAKDVAEKLVAIARKTDSAASSLPTINVTLRGRRFFAISAVRYQLP